MVRERLRFGKVFVGERLPVEKGSFLRKAVSREGLCLEMVPVSERAALGEVCLRKRLAGGHTAMGRGCVEEKAVMASEIHSEKECIFLPPAPLGRGDWSVQSMWPHMLNVAKCPRSRSHRDHGALFTNSLTEESSGQERWLCALTGRKRKVPWWPRPGKCPGIRYKSQRERH